MPSTEGKRPVERGAIGLAALAGASAWISLGTVAVINLDGDRIGALPSIWLGVGAVVVAAAIAWATRLETADAWPLALTTALWLPWLPWPVPASLLIWEGPLEALIWTAAIGAVVASRVPRTWTGAWLDPRVAPALAGVLVLACSIGGAVALGERIPGGDEPHYLVITQSLLRDGDLRIENNHRRGDYLAYYPSVTPPDFLQRGTNGEIYSIHAPGLSLLLLPAFAGAGYAGAVIFVALLCAGAAVLLWRSSYALTSDAGASWAATLAVAFSAPFLLHTFAIFPDPLGAVVVSAAVALLVRFETAAERVRQWHLVGVGALLALLPWLHTRFSIVAGAIACCVALRLWHRPQGVRQVINFLAVPILAVIAWLSYFWIIYGTPDPTAPYGGSQQNAARWIFNGLTGLLFDQQFGVLANAPVLLMAPMGAAFLWRERRRLLLELAAIAVPYLLVVSSFAMWWGGWSAPGRFTVTVLPLVVLPLAYAWLEGHPAIRLPFIGLLLISLGVAGARVLALDGRLLHNERNGYDVLLDWASPAVNLPLAMPAVHRTGWSQALVVGTAWILAAVVAIAILDSLTRTRVRPRGARWAVACGIGLVAATAAMTLSLAIAHATPLTPESSKVSFLARWNPRVRPTIVDISQSLVPTQQLWPALRLRPSNRAADQAAMPVLFEARWLPAGDYRVVIEGQPWQTTTLTASIGGPLLEAWRIAPGQDPAGLVLRLPAQVQSLSIRSDDTRSPQSIQVVLEPLLIRSRRERVEGIAIRAARYNGVAAFFFDDRAYVEPGGLWTRGHAVTDLLVTAGDRREVEATIQAGPVATEVQLRSDAWSTRVELSPGEGRVVAIPAGRVVSIATAGGFRPIDHDPGVGDERPLGVRVEFK